MLWQRCTRGDRPGLLGRGNQMGDLTRIGLGLVAALAAVGCGQKRELNQVASEEPQELVEQILAPTSQVYSERGYGEYRFGSALPELYQKKAVEPYCSNLEGAEDAEGRTIYFSSKAEVIGLCSKRYRDIARYESMIEQKFGRPRLEHVRTDTERGFRRIVTFARHWVLEPETMVYVRKTEGSAAADGICFHIYDRKFVVDALRQHVKKLWDTLDALPLTTPGPEMSNALKTAGLQPLAEYKAFESGAPLAGTMVLNLVKIGDYPTHPLFTEGTLRRLVYDVVYVKALTQFFPPAAGGPSQSRSRIFGDTVTRWAASNGWDVEVFKSVQKVYLLRAQDEGGV